MPTWSEFAWASFLSCAYDGDKVYQQIMNNTDLLNHLKNCPEDLSPTKIQKLVIEGFLNRWSCRLPNNESVAREIRDALIDLKPHLMSIKDYTLRDNFSTVVNNNIQSKLTLGEVIESCYLRLCKCTRNFAGTATTKLLHVIHPSLFVMWDAPMRDYYRKQNYLIKETSRGYVLFLEQMQRLIFSIDKAFASASLEPPPAKNQVVEDYLSSRMGYNPPKTAAKYIDEYNWIVITRKVIVPPTWHP